MVEGGIEVCGGEMVGLVGQGEISRVWCQCDWNHRRIWYIHIFAKAITMANSFLKAARWYESEPMLLISGS